MGWGEGYLSSDEMFFLALSDGLRTSREIQFSPKSTLLNGLQLGPQGAFNCLQMLAVSVLLPSHLRRFEKSKYDSGSSIATVMDGWNVLTCL